MGVTECFCRLCRIRLQETRIRMWQIHHQKMDLAFNAADDGKGLTKVCLCMTRRMGKGNKHLALPQPGHEYVILHDRDTAFKAMLITQAFKYPL